MSNKIQSDYAGPVNSVNTTKNSQGQITATTTVKHDSIKSCSEITQGTHLPGVIILVHGVNSEGEWYNPAEQYLCEGLNKRLGIGGQKEYELKPNIYSYGDKEKLLQKNDVTYLQESNRSPVIRFYWGYRSADEELDLYQVPLRNRQGESYQQQILDIKSKDQEEIARQKKAIVAKGPYFWGGGPFQNGTTNLVQSWSEFGFDNDIWGVFNPQWVNPEQDRLLTKGPPRRYYAHASWRLAMLIQRIRDNYPDDTITLVSHSQGTMISMGASLISSPDALFVMNSPYRMFHDFMDGFTLESPDNSTDQARENTLAKVVEAVAQHYEKLKNNPRLQSRLSVGKPRAGEVAWTLDKEYEGGIKERDNHGRTYIYCNAHDRVMGSTPLKSIGWQGLPNDMSGNPHKLLMKYEGKLFQRLLARSMLVGGKPNPQTPFGALQDMFTDKTEIVVEHATAINARQAIYNYEAGIAFKSHQVTKKVFNEPFWDDMEYTIKIPTLYAKAAPFLPVQVFGAVSYLSEEQDFSLMPVWETPPAYQTMFINGEEVPNPVQLTKAFDQVRNNPAETNKNEGWGETNVIKTDDGQEEEVPVDNTYRYYEPLYRIYYGKLEHRTVITYHMLDTVPANFDNSLAAKKRRAENRLQGRYGIENGWVIEPTSAYYDTLPILVSCKFMYAEMTTQTDKNSEIWFDGLKKYISRPTDHSTLPQHSEFLSQVMAYDLPIGFGYSIDPKGYFKEELIRQADWTLPDSDPYMEEGILALDADNSLLAHYFAGQTLLPSTRPAQIDTEHLLSVKDSIYQTLKSYSEFHLKLLMSAKEGLEKSLELYGESQIIQAQAQIELANQQLEFLAKQMDSLKNGISSGLTQIGENELRNAQMQQEIARQQLELIRNAANKLGEIGKSSLETIGKAELERAKQQNLMSQELIKIIKNLFNF